MSKIRDVVLCADAHSDELAADFFGLKVETVRRYRRWCRDFPQPSIQEDQGNILIIPDLHAPFIKKGYLDFCTRMAKKWNCTKFIFIGDLIDNHYSGYHETDPDGLSGRAELELAIEQIHDFHKAFPVATVLIGNHDAIPNRKAFTSGVSSRWVRSIGETLGVPNWEFKETHWEGDIMFVHGIGRKAHTRMRQDMVSVVQGHYHAESYIKWQVGANRRTFAMQLGCGVDSASYAAAYAKHFMAQHINVGVLLNGKTPLIEYMD